MLSCFYLPDGTEKLTRQSPAADWASSAFWSVRLQEVRAKKRRKQQINKGIQTLILQQPGLSKLSGRRGRPSVHNTTPRTRSISPEPNDFSEAQALGPVTAGTSSLPLRTAYETFVITSLSPEVTTQLSESQSLSGPLHLAPVPIDAVQLDLQSEQPGYVVIVKSQPSAVQKAFKAHKARLARQARAANVPWYQLVAGGVAPSIASEPDVERKETADPEHVVRAPTSSPTSTRPLHTLTMVRVPSIGSLSTEDEEMKYAELDSSDTVTTVTEDEPFALESSPRSHSHSRHGQPARQFSGLDSWNPTLLANEEVPFLHYFVRQTTE